MLIEKGTSETLAPANKTGHQRINYAKVYTTKFLNVVVLR